MNTQLAPWSDVHVRRAVAYALNRQDIIAANGGYASPSYTLIPPVLFRTIASQQQVNALLGSIPLYYNNIVKAKQEMALSAYPHGFSGVLEEYNTGSAPDISQVIIAELQKIGVNLQIKLNPLPTYTALVTGPAKERPVNFGYDGCPSPDVSALGYLLGSWNTKLGQFNIADYAPPAVDKLLTEGNATTDPAKRFAAYSKILRYLANDVPYVRLYTQDVSIALSGRFKIVGYTQWTFQYGDYALDIRQAR
jgi:peptide/nickel transport system substrate-binding protein